MLPHFSASSQALLFSCEKMQLFRKTGKRLQTIVREELTPVIESLEKENTINSLQAIRANINEEAMDILAPITRIIHARSWVYNPKILHKLENLNLGNTVHRNFLMALIQNGQAKWVMRNLERISFDLDNQQHISIFIALIQNGQAKWVAERLKTVSLELNNENHRNLLIALCYNKYSLWAKEKLDEVVLNWDNRPHRDMVLKLIENGQAEWARNKLKGIILHLNDNDDEHLLILIAFIENGQAEWVMRHLERISFDLDQYQHISILVALIQNRQAEWVVKKLGDLSLALNTAGQIIISLALIQSQKTKWVMNKLDGISFDLHNQQHISLLLALIQNGQAEWVTKKLEKVSFDLNHEQQREMLLTLIETGQDEWALSKLEGIPFDPNNSQLTIILLTFIKKGHRMWVINKLKEVLFDVSNPSHYAFLQSLIGSGITTSEPHLHKVLSQVQYSTINEVNLKHRASLNEKRNRLFKTYKNIVQSLNSTIQENTVNAIQDEILPLIQTLPLEMVFFIEKAVEIYGALSPSILSFYDNLLGRKNSFVCQIPKDGSTLSVYGKKKANNEFEYTFVNDIPTQSAQVWQKMHDLGLSVADIIASPLTKADITRVYSRYSGFSVDQLQEITPFLMPEIKRQQRAILQAVKENHCLHGHDKDANFTVEFVNQATKAIIFDVREYLQNPEKYEMVVRLIDWDLAKIIP